MNPCRCGYLGSQVRACTCPAGLLARYRARVSGPLLDRFDLCVEMGDGHLTGLGVRSRPAAVATAGLQRARELLEDRRDPPASWALPRRVRAYGLDNGAVGCLEGARRPFGLSVRGVLRCCRVARTVAALDGSFTVSARHVQEALQYRREAVPGWS